ncbi:hypothetical protein [Limnobacter sp.]
MIIKRKMALATSALLTVGTLTLAGCGSQEGGANAAATPALPKV